MKASHRLAVGVLLVGALFYTARRAAAAVPSPGEVLGAAGDAAANAFWHVSPTNPDNVIAGAANQAATAATGRPETVGGLLHEFKLWVTGTDPVTSWKPPPARTAAGFIGEGVPSGIPAWDRAYERLQPAPPTATYDEPGLPPYFAP